MQVRAPALMWLPGPLLPVKTVRWRSGGSAGGETLHAAAAPPCPLTSSCGCLPRDHIHAADEPVKPYEQLDDRAKELIQAIQERQAYIQAGKRRELGMKHLSQQRRAPAGGGPRGTGLVGIPVGAQRAWIVTAEMCVS